MASNIFLQFTLYKTLILTCMKNVKSVKAIREIGQQVSPFVGLPRFKQNQCMPLSHSGDSDRIIDKTKEFKVICYMAFNFIGFSLVFYTKHRLWGFEPTTLVLDKIYNLFLF